MEKDQKYLMLASLLLFFAIIASFSGAPREQKKAEEQLSNSQSKTMETEQGSVKSANEDVEGLQVEILKEGSEGQVVQKGDTITVHYTGTLEDGTKFDSSVDRGTPFSTQIGVGQVIKGWDIGMIGMKIGEKRKLTIASDLAYGDSGIPGAIPGGATLIFEVELLSID
jgi:FKBP-type peptidyl-prolyl cis-trans isomerase